MDLLRLSLRQLQIFVAVAQSGSTSAASEAIALSQSATSAAVNELERMLSLQLFDRAGRRLLLNDNGRALLPRALRMLCLLYTSPSPRDRTRSRMPSSA